MALVSIIIPTYNRAHLIGDAIRSALAQTHMPCEILVVDDGSRDDTATVVGAFGDAVRYIRQANSGVEVARNMGVTQSSGELIHFLDSDDVLEPRAIERLLALLEAHPAAGIAYGQSRVIDQRGAETRRYAPPIGRAAGELMGARELAFLSMRNYLCVGSVLLRRAVWDMAGGFDPRCHGVCEDWHLWARVASRTNVCYLPEVVLTVREQPGSLLTQISAARTQDYLATRRMLLDAIFTVEDVRTALGPEQDRIEAYYLYEVAWMAYATHDVAAARRELKAAIRRYPRLLRDGDMREARRLWLKLRLPAGVSTALRGYKRGSPRSV